MKVSFFIDRPVFSAVISIVIVIVGIIGLTMLPVDQYPQITPPVVKISASYPGASALTVSQAVATPIEQEINGTPGMLYMESSSSNSGGFSATVTFDVSADPDLAAVEIQNRVKLGKSYVRPEMPLPDSLAQQQDSLSIADEQWQIVYTDSTLRSLIARALDHNKDMLIAATLVPDLERRISLKENDIAFLVGEFPSRIKHVSFLQELDVPQSLPVGLPSDLLERRPDIRAAEQQLRAEHARVKVAYTNMFPRLALTGQFGLESDALSNFLQSPYSLLNGAVLTPLFGWGKNRAALKAQKASFEAEVHTYEKTVLNAFKEARNAIVDFNKIKEVYQLRAKLERSARGYVELAQLQYINGVINYLDVLDAQRGYFDAQIGVSNAIRDELIAMVHVYKALGGGAIFWPPFAPRFGVDTQ